MPGASWEAGYTQIIIQAGAQTLKGNQELGDHGKAMTQGVITLLPPFILLYLPFSIAERSGLYRKFCAYLQRYFRGWPSPYSNPYPSPFSLFLSSILRHLNIVQLICLLCFLSVALKWTISFKRMESCGAALSPTACNTIWFIVRIHRYLKF